MNSYKNIDEYIKSSPEETREKLEEIRSIIKKTAPNSIETIAYGIPTIKLNGGNLVHFGGFKNHIGFYPTPSGITKFKKELKPFIGGKGTVKFPLEKPLPHELIVKIVKLRVLENNKSK